MTVFNFPADEHHFRDQTAGQGALAGCMLPSFRCPRCHQAREDARAAKAAQEVRA